MDSDEVDFGAVIGIIWNGRWVVMAAALLCGLSGLAYAVFTKPWYRSEVVLVQTDSSGATLGLAQLGGLASLAGINIGGAASSSQTPLAVLRSRDLVREFIQKENLVPKLFPERWDTRTQKWDSRSHVPDIQDAVARFDEEIRTVSEDSKAGVVRLVISWSDPQASAAWANELVGLVNSRLREQAVVEAQRNIDYLRGVLKEATIAPLQSSISKLLESELQKLMIARGSDQYAFKVVDGAVIPKKPFRPRRMVIVAGSALLGVFLSVLFLLLRHGTRRLAVRLRTSEIIREAELPESRSSRSEK